MTVRDARLVWSDYTFYYGSVHWLYEVTFISSDMDGVTLILANGQRIDATMETELIGLYEPRNHD